MIVGGFHTILRPSQTVGKGLSWKLLVTPLFHVEIETISPEVEMKAHCIDTACLSFGRGLIISQEPNIQSKSTTLFESLFESQEAERVFKNEMIPRLIFADTSLSSSQSYSQEQLLIK